MEPLSFTQGRRRPAASRWTCVAAFAVALGGAALGAPASGAKRRKEPEPEPVQAEVMGGDEAEEDEVVTMGEVDVDTTLARYAEGQNSAATKVSMNPRDVPRSVNVLNSAFLRDIRAQSFEDLYPYMSGLTQSGSGAASFSLRGFAAGGGTLNNVQIDGLPGLVSRFGANSAANVERIELVKGPMSVLYGPMNPSGIMNVVTKRPLAKTRRSLMVSVTGYAAGAGLIGSHGRLGHEFGKTATIDLSGPLRDKRWQYRFIAAEEDLRSFRSGVWFRNWMVAPSLAYHWGRYGEVVVKGEFVRQARFSDSGIAVPFDSVSLAPDYDTVYQEDSAKEHDTGEAVELNFKRRFDNDWTLRIRGRSVYHTDGKRAFENSGVVSAISPDQSLVTRRYRNQNTRRLYDYADFNLYREFQQGGAEHLVFVGWTFGYEKFDGLRAALGPTAAPVALYGPAITAAPYPSDGVGADDPITKTYNYAGYAWDQVSLGRRWLLSGGFRVHRQDSSTANPVQRSLRRQTVKILQPSAGVVYRPVKTASLYCSYSASFRPQIPGSIANAQGNSNFPPEKAFQVEMGLKSVLDARKLVALFAVYDIRKTDVVEPVPGLFLPDGTQVSQVVGEQESTGAEASLTYRPVPNWQWTADATYVDARTTSSPNPVLLRTRNPNVPRVTANFFSRYNVRSGFLRRVSLSLGCRYTGAQMGNVTPDPARRLRIPGAARFDAGIYYTRPSGDFVITIQNVLDRRFVAGASNAYSVKPGIPRKMTASWRRIF